MVNGNYRRREVPYSLWSIEGDHFNATLYAKEVANLVTETDSWRFWSLFIVKRTVLKTTCTVLK